MNALTVHQPYAAFWAAGIKGCETRSWPAPKSAIGKELNIHAGKRPIRFAELDAREMATCSALLNNVAHPRGEDLLLACGEIIAIGTLSKCLQVIEFGNYPEHPGEAPFIKEPRSYPGALMSDGSIEWFDGLGNFAAGRWLWFLDDVKVLPEFHACSGKQGVWRVDMAECDL